MKSQRYAEELSFATQLALDAGRVTIENFGQHTAADWKEDNTPVTKADLDINQLVIERVREAFPEDGVLGEEFSSEEGRDRLWVVDPIDGTQPFSLGMPLSTFCIALVIDKQPVMGIIYDPFTERMYQAVQGEGAFMNAEKLAVSDAGALNQGYVVLSSRMGGKFATPGQAFDRIADAGGKAFNFRSIAYGCMLVATGHAVGAAAGYLKPWDAAATMVILQEAGAKVTDFAGNQAVFDKNNDGFLVSNGKTHDQLLGVINK